MAAFEIEPSKSELSDPQAPLWRADIDWTREPARADVRVTAGKNTEHRQIPFTSRALIMEQLLESPGTSFPWRSGPDAVGHRIVHGGPEYRRPHVITPEVRSAIEQYAVYAPQHNPAALEGVDLVDRSMPGVPQVAVFDTGFHADLPPAAKVYPVPYAWYERGLFRYGFHGINHQFCAMRAAALLRTRANDLRLITCHLGNGASLAAISKGKSVDTTMGFTPLEGVMMGSRSGSVDPGLILQAAKDGLSTEEIEAVLDRQSGLRGISGVSADMRDVMRGRAQGDARCALAFDIYVHRLCFHIGAMLASLDRLDGLVFSGGVGENSAELRSGVCERLRVFGIEIDPAKNSASASDGLISNASSRAAVLVIHAQEDWAIASECATLPECA